MATFSRKESVLLGYNYSHPITAPESPDIDFGDVFGGPPRRASIQDMRCSFSETKDSFGEYETTSRRHHRWSGLSEKPVFGEERFNSRRYASDDFFDDIFRGNDSLSSSPRDPFNSNPASKVASPGRPISPRVSEPFASSSLPAQLSLPGKLINHHKNKDGISNGLFSHAPLSRFSSQVQEESRNYVSSQSSLSREISAISDESARSERPEEVNKDRNLKKDSADSEVPSVGHQFHFSIYKWASKGVPLSLPFRGAHRKMMDKIKFDRSSSASGRIACEGMAKESPTVTLNKIDSGFSTFVATVSSDDNSCEIELDNTKNSSNVYVVQSKPVEEAIHDNSDIQDLKADKVPFSAAKQDAPKSNLKTLRSLFSGNNEGKEPEESEVKSAKKSFTAYDDAVKKQSKQDEKGMAMNNTEIEKSNTHGTPICSQDIPAKSRANGKIKELLKMYDQETSEQSKLKDASLHRSFRWKERADRSKFRTQDNQSLPTSNIYVDHPRTSTPAATEKVRTDNYEPTNISSGSSESTAASIPNGSEARDGHGPDSFYENIEITELTQDEDGLQQAGSIQDEIQITDAEIRKWSQGKQKNIRSLLSTLQYVLWPESGWKPVPLVDIIEGNAVKRSYQKALLSLHPDKLQQKGATSHQKYVAENVFDVLQEAWTHFNLLGSM